MQQATFVEGCFCGVQYEFDQLKGVKIITVDILWVGTPKTLPMTNCAPIKPGMQKSFISHLMRVLFPMTVC